MSTQIKDMGAEDWAGMDGATAWHLIDRHGEGWEHVGKMMDEWIAANRTAPAISQQEATARLEAERDALRTALSNLINSTQCDLLTYCRKDEVMEVFIPRAAWVAAVQVLDAPKAADAIDSSAEVAS